jgi:hypothetical protein
MSVLRRVEGSAAGPFALGVLLPPGRQTYLILRPRGLSWDMLLLRSAESTLFRDLTRDEGERAVRTLYGALEAWLGGGHGCVETTSCSELDGFLVRALIGSLSFLVCPREPGKPYRPQVFGDAADAEVAALRVSAALRPPAGRELEVYCNTRHFER